MTQQIINIGTGPSTGDGDPLRTAFSEINSNFTELYGTINGQAVTFSNVSGVTTSLGSGATFDVVRYVNNYAPIINRSGSGYSVGNVITIYGNLIGGAYSTQDLTITVATLGNATLGNIATVTFSGIPAQPVTSVAGRTGNVVLTVNDIIGLSNAYAIASSTATANVAMRGYVDTKIAANIAALINGAPGALDTLQELAAALGNNASFSAAIINSLATTNSNLIVSNTTTRAYVDGQIIAANSGVASAVTLANTGLKGYVDFTNSVLSTEIATANIGLKGYVDQANTIQSAQLAAANVGIIGYIDQANTIQSAQIAAANVGVVGYIDLANTIQSGQVGAANLAIIAANLGMKGYVDSVATLSIYSNVNTKAYTESMGFSNYSNSNVRSYLTGGFDGNILPSANVTYSLGSPTQQWKDLYVSNNTIYIGGTPLSSTPGGLTFAGVPVSSFAPTSATTVTPGTVWNFANTGRATNQLFQPSYGAGKFIVVETGNYGGVLWPNIGLYSSDGATWSTMYMPNVAQLVGPTIYGGDKFVSIYTGHGNTATSTDGINWTFNQNVIPPYGVYGYDFYRGLLAYGNGRFVALTGYTTRRSVISTDGITWSNGAMSLGSVDDLPATDRQGYSLLYQSLAFTDGVFVASATRFNGTGGNLIAYSADGVSWGNIQLPWGHDLTSGYILGAGGGVFVGVPNASGRVGIRSVNGGRTWSNISLPDVYNYTSVVYGGGAFILTPASADADVALSTDGGTTWANVATPYNSYVGGGAYGAGTFIAAGFLYANVLNISYSNSVGTLTLAPTLPGTIDRVDIGVSTPGSGSFTVLSADSISTSGDISTTGNISTTGDILAGNVSLSDARGNTTVTIDSYTGNISAGNVDVYTVTTDKIDTSNITTPGGNLTISSPTVVTGNVTANYFVGNGSQLSALPGYAYSNVNVAAYVTTSNSAIIGYIDQANSIQSAQITAANVGMQGYVDSQSFYSNAKVATYLQAGNISNVSLAGNVTAAYFVGNGALLTGISGGVSSYSNVQVATYLPTYSGNIANIRIGTSGALTFADGTTQTTAASGGGSSYGNANVASYLPTYSGNVGNLTTKSLTVSDHTLLPGANPQIFTVDNTNIKFINYLNRNTSYAYRSGILTDTYNDGYTVVSNEYSGSSTSTLFTFNFRQLANGFEGERLGTLSFDSGIDNGPSLSTSVTMNYRPTANGSGNYGFGRDTLNITDIPVVNITAGNLSVVGNITANYFTGNGSQLTGLPASYSNVQVATYLPTYSGNIANIRLGTSGVLTFADGTTQTTAASGGGSSYGNANVTAYTVSMGFTNFSNVNVAAYVTTANSAIIGYIDQANTIQSAQIGAANLAITAANVGMKGYVDAGVIWSISASGTSDYVFSGPGIVAGNTNDPVLYLYKGLTYTFINTTGGSHPFAIRVSNGGADYTSGVSGSQTGTQTFTVPMDAPSTLYYQCTIHGVMGNAIHIGCIDNNYSNVNVKAYAETMGYQNYGNVNVAAYVTTANSAIIGYIDLANTIQSAQVNAANLAITAANLGMKGYVDSVASQNIYGNGNVKSYLTEFDGNIIPSANVTYSLGNVTNRWKDLYLSGNTIFLGDSTISTEGGRLVTTGVAISPPTGAVGFANVQFEAATNFDQIRSYYVDNNFGYTANLKSWSSAPIVWDELRSSKIKINSSIVAGSTPDFASLDTSGGRFANAVATLDATGNIASLTITDGGVSYDAYYPYYATDPTGYDSNYIGQPFNSGSPTGKSFRRIGLIPTTAGDIGNITSVGSFTRYSDLPTVGTNSYTWTGNTGTTISFTVDWSSNTVTAYTYTPALPALTSANDWQNWLLDYQSTNDYGWIVGSGSITGGGGTPIQAVYDYLNREALPNSLTYDESNTTWYPGNLLVNNSATIATLSSSTFFVEFNRTSINYATLENDYGNPVYWSRGLSAESGISSGGDMTVAGDLRVTGDLYVSPDSIYLGDLQLSSSSGNLVVHGNVTANNITVGNIAGSVNGYSIGYRDVPQITVANLTLIASDAGKHYYGANTNPTTITIPTNASVAFGNGTAISIVNQGTGNITVANAAGVLLYLAGNSTAGSRTLTSYGMATLIKVQVNTWFINGTGVV